MAGFGKTNNQIREDEDVIIIHLGHLSDEQFNRVQESVIEFMNKRWPNVRCIGIDN